MGKGRRLLKTEVYQRKCSVDLMQRRGKQHKGEASTCVLGNSKIPLQQAQFLQNSCMDRMYRRNNTLVQRMLTYVTRGISMPKTACLHVSSRTIKCAMLVGALVWIVVVAIFHQKLVIRHKLLDSKATPVRHRSVRFRSILCQEQVVEINDRECAKRLKYLEANKHRNACFLAHGVLSNASQCAIFKYLVYVERVCPEPKSAAILFAHLMATSKKEKLLQENAIATAKCRMDVRELLNKMDMCGEVCEWIKTRIKTKSADWVDAIGKVAAQKKMGVTERKNAENKPEQYATRRRLKILLHMGLLTKEYGLNFGEGASVGGPLGELVQWADLAAAIHLLGHDVLLSWSPNRLSQILKLEYNSQNLCRKAAVADVLFTDITGLEQIRTSLGTLYNYRCRLRILDVYGTEPEFNHPRYINRSTSGTWGGKGLDPQQFFTQFPHSPDNSFLGFVVPEFSGELPKANENQALLYGKSARTLREPGILTFLEILRHYFSDIHATIKLEKKTDPTSSSVSLPDFVTNHGALSQEKFTNLLRSSRVYVGLGWPVEGPAGLEAVANGVTFLNSKFSPPRNPFAGKPTSRRLTSQNPYAEEFLGEPYVYTVDIRNREDVDMVLKKIKFSNRPKSKVNHEFTYYGFIERVNAYLENQDFCDAILDSDVTTGTTWKRREEIWPPKYSFRVKEAVGAESCFAACKRYNLTCERAFFSLLNSVERFKDLGRECVSSTYIIERLQNGENKTWPLAKDLCHAPSFDLQTGSCIIQSDALLYSCVCETPTSLIRLCPCRTYRNEQIAICDGCE